MATTWPTGSFLASNRPARRPLRRLSLTPPVVWLWPPALALMQVTLVRYPTFDLTVSVVVCHLIQLYLLTCASFHRPSTAQLAITLIVLSQILILGAGAGDLAGFSRSFAHVLNLILMVLIAANLKVDDWRAVRRSLAVMCVCGILVSALVAGQFVAFNLLDQFGPARPFGSWTPSLAPGIERFYEPALQAGLKRPNGPFSEPSVAGWFLVFTAALALAGRPVHPRLAAATVLISGTGAALTLSLTGILGMLVLLGVWLVSVRDDRRFKLVVLGAVAALALAAAGSAASTALLERAAEIERPGTSIHLRFIAPFDAVVRSLLDAPQGVAIGQLAPAIEAGALTSWLGGIDPNLDNMLFTIVLHFGLLGVVMNLGYVIEVLWVLFARRRPVGLILLALLLVMLATGAGWAHQSVLLIGYAILVGRYLAARDRKPRAGRGRRRSTRPPRPAAPRSGRPEAAPPRVAWLRPSAPP